MVEDLLIKDHISRGKHLIQARDLYPIYIRRDISNQVPDITPRIDFKASLITLGYSVFIERISSTPIYEHLAPIRAEISYP